MKKILFIGYAYFCLLGLVRLFLFFQASDYLIILNEIANRLGQPPISSVSFILAFVLPPMFGIGSVILFYGILKNHAFIRIWIFPYLTVLLLYCLYGALSPYPGFAVVPWEILIGALIFTVINIYHIFSDSHFLKKDRPKEGVDILLLFFSVLGISFPLLVFFNCYSMMTDYIDYGWPRIAGAVLLSLALFRILVVYNKHKATASWLVWVAIFFCILSLGVHSSRTTYTSPDTIPASFKNSH